VRVGLARARLILVLLAAAGCGAPSPTLVAPSGPVVSFSPSSATSATPAPSAGGAPSPSAAAPPSTPATSAGPTAGGGPVDDPGLLAVLPEAIGDVPVTEEPTSFADAVTDPSFAANVASAAFGIAVDGADLASGVVAHLRPGVFSDAFFRDWRDSYDRGACAQAGGVTGHAEAQLGGRTVYITSCAGGLRTYHAAIPDRDLVVSLFSVGERRFGEQLMAGLRP
jgi:hypothetical protein